VYHDCDGVPPAVRVPIPGGLRTQATAARGASNASATHEQKWCAPGTLRAGSRCVTLRGAIKLPVTDRFG
jgi:hypothetical protein